MNAAERFEQEAIAHFTRPWPKRRGVEPSDAGHDTIVIRAAPSDVVAACARRGFTPEADVFGKEVTIGDTFGFVVRLAGYSWTTLLWGEESGDVPTPAELSQDLGAPVLHLVSW